MTPWLEDADVTLYHGDVLAVLRELPAESVDCCVTSPPYWGLRDYGQEGQLGLEPTPEEYVTCMVEVFREVRRVLASHGTVWLNLGDSFDDKQLVGVPWRVAFALQADGWYLRSDIIWAKPNPMPESVTDRPTKSHEFVFLLSKAPRYFFDQEAVREAYEYGGLGLLRGRSFSDDEHVSWHAPSIRTRQATGDRGYPAKEPPQEESLDAEAIRRKRSGGSGARGAGDARAMSAEETGRTDGFTKPPRNAMNPAGRNIRSVWEIATQPYPEAHFATFPEELARRCIAAGCPEQVCRVCGKARERVVEKEYELVRAPREAFTPKGVPHAAGIYDGLKGHSGTVGADGRSKIPNVTTAGFTDCGHDDYRPGLTLDPFIGSGTVAHVARKLGRHAIGIDLNESYLQLAARRLQQQSLFASEMV